MNFKMIRMRKSELSSHETYEILEKIPQEYLEPMDKETLTLKRVDLAFRDNLIEKMSTKK